MVRWSVLSRAALPTVLLFLGNGSATAQSSPFLAAIADLSCARELTLGDLANEPIADIAGELATLSTAAGQAPSMSPEVRHRLSQLLDQMDAYAEVQRQKGGASTGSANALAASGAVLDANIRLGSPDAILSMANIAAILIELNCRDDALRLLEIAAPRARELAQTPGFQRYLIAVLQSKAPALGEGGHLQEAIAVYQELEDVLARSGDFHQRSTLELGVRINKAVMLRRLGRLSEAEAVIDDAVKLANERFGEDSNEAGFALNTLAVFYSAVGAGVDLGPIHDRIIRIRLRHLGDNKFDTAISYQNRAQWRRFSGDADGATADFLEALRILDRAGLGQSGRALAIRSRLALLYSSLGRRTAAAAEFRISEAIAKGSVEISPLRLAQFAHEYAWFLSDEDPGAALKFFDQAIDARRKHLGDAHPFLAESLTGRANTRMRAGGDPQAVYEDFKAASDVYGRWLSVEASKCRAGNPPLGDQAKQTIASAVLMATTLAEHLAATEQAELLSDIVRLIQIASANDVSVALAQLALRSGETEALRTYQDLLDEACGLEASIQSLRAAGVKEESSRELSGLLARLERIDRRLDTLAAELDPALIDELTAAEQILDTVAVSEHLRIGDSALVFLVLDDFLLRVDIERLGVGLGIRAFANLALGAKQLRAMVHALNVSIASRAFDRTIARKLFDALFADFDPSGEGHIYIVTDGGIDRLSFSVLLDGKNRWIADRWKHSVIPSLNALAQLGRLASTGRRSNSFFGIGDPALSLTGGECVREEDEEVASELGAFLTGRGAAAHAEEVRALCSLSHASAELRSVAGLLGGGEDQLLLGPTATEKAVKDHDFSGVGILSFATHGLMPGAELDLPEPALILTPGDAARDGEDDGVLLASDIASLALDDVWLATLSACDTSAGAAGGEGLSGIGRSFLYAGVETLLVSHWAVDDAATKELLEAFFAALYGNVKATVSEALQQAMASLRRDRPEPYFWGPFTIVGDGALYRP